MPSQDIRVLFNNKELPIINPVSDQTALNAITTTNLLTGSLCHVISDEIVYQWNGSAWDALFSRVNVSTNNPTSSDNGSSGYYVFSLWLNSLTGTYYICSDSSPTSATWVSLKNYIDPSLLPEDTDIVDGDRFVLQKGVDGSLKQILKSSLDNKFFNPSSLPSDPSIEADDKFIIQKGADNSLKHMLKSTLDNEFFEPASLPIITVGDSDYVAAVTAAGEKGKALVSDLPGGGEQPNPLDPVSVGTGGKYATFEDAVAAGKLSWVLVSDYTISTDFTLPQAQAGINSCSLYIKSGKLLTATASILIGNSKLHIEHEDPEYKKIVYTAPSAGKYFIMFNAANDEDGEVVVANNFGFDNQSTHENTGPFGNVEVQSNGRIVCLGADADNAGLSILSKNSFLNEVEAGTRQTDPVNALIVNGKVDQAIVSGNATFASSLNNTVKIEQYGVVRSLKPQGTGGLNIGVSGRLESILNLASFPINLNITGSNAYVGNGDLATDGNTDPAASTGAITFSSGVHYATLENLTNVWGPIGGTDASDSTGHIYRNCHFSGTNTVFMTSNTLIDKCTYNSGTFKMGNTSLLPGVQPQQCTISNCTAAAFEQASGAAVYKSGNNVTIGNTNNQYRFLSKTFSDNNYTASAQDNILWDASGGASTLNLPDASKCLNGEIIVMKSDTSANHIDLAAQSGQNIVGETTLSTYGDHTRLVSDGVLTWRSYE